MSSLRRRAICDAAREVDRAQLDRRARERAHDGAARRPGRRAAAATRARRGPRRAGRRPPRRRAGRARARSSSATATAWPSRATERTSTRDPLRRDALARTSRSTSAATPCACARSFAPRQKRTSPPASPRSSASRCGPRAARRPRAPRRGRARGQRKRLLEAHDRRVRAARPRSRAGSSRPRRGSAGSPGRRRPATVEVARAGGEQRRRAAAAREVRDPATSSTSTWRWRSATRARDVRALAQQPQRAQHEVAGVERARLGEQAVVREVELRRTRARARPVARRLLGSARPTPRSPRRSTARPSAGRCAR